MAHVMVPFANGKGGVGKTALACSYAVTRAQQGADVILADVNEDQQTAFNWSKVRDHNALLPKIRVEVKSARQALELIGRCDVLVVDTPGWTDKSTLEFAKRASFMVIPTGPNPTYELAPTVRLLHGLRAEGIESWRLGIVLTRFSADEATRSQEDQFARSYLGQAGYMALDGCIRNAPAYSAGLAVGYGMTEIPDAAQLVKEAAHLLDSIGTGLSRALRRMGQFNAPGRENEHERGGRDR